MEARASVKYARISPRKVKIVLDLDNNTNKIFVVILPSK